MNLMFIIQLCVAVASAAAVITTCIVMVRVMRADMKDLRGEMNQRFDKVYGEIKDLRGEMNVRFEKVDARLGALEVGQERLRGDIKALRAERGRRDYDDDDEWEEPPSRRPRSAAE